MRKLLLRHNLIIALLILLLLPGALALLVTLSNSHIIFKWMTPNYKLNGMTTETASPSFNLLQIKSHTVQKYIEDKITNQLPLRSLFIRLNNQLYYSLFKKSYSEQGQVIIGKSNQLIIRGDIDTYCANKARKITELTEWADKLSALNTFFKKRNQLFVYVITPSKAEYMPDMIPDRFHCKNNGMASHLQKIEQLLTERHILYVNGTSLMADATKQYNTPMFPRGGIHWNTLGASLGVNATIETINHANHSFLSPALFSYTITQEPKGQDRDMLNLLNLAHPDDNYPVPMVDFKPALSSAQPVSVACIGGSFLRQMIDIFLQNKTFSKISFYRYFKLDKTDFEGNKSPIKQDVDLSYANTFADILAANVVILEENSSITVSNHGQLFYATMKKFYI
jgi:alginate O-acetyltransferase complex protein AlgJ